MGSQGVSLALRRRREINAVGMSQWSCKEHIYTGDSPSSQSRESHVIYMGLFLCEAGIVEGQMLIKHMPTSPAVRIGRQDYLSCVRRASRPCKGARSWPLMREMLRWVSFGREPRLSTRANPCAPKLTESRGTRRNCTTQQILTQRESGFSTPRFLKFSPLYNLQTR